MIAYAPIQTYANNYLIAELANQESAPMVCKIKKRPAMFPDPFLACIMGSGNKTSMWKAVKNSVT